MWTAVRSCRTGCVWHGSAVSLAENQAWKVDGKFLRSGGGRSFLRGITYGPFNSGGASHGLPSEAQYQRDLDQIGELGVNTLRLARTPTHEFLAACDDRGLQVFITLAWEDFVDFLSDPEVSRKILRQGRRVVSEFSDARCVAGYFVGNEIGAQLVRWMGPSKVKAFLEEMIAAGRACDPGSLFAYANYPTTEYLNPANADFVAYNVYLEKRVDFARYLRRMQHLAGNRPLVISEFGLDSMRNGMEKQAEVLDWACEEMVRSGVAGTMLFTFTDEWFTSGREMTEWAFGLVDRDRNPKPAFQSVRERFTNPSSPLTFLETTPSISVIVCTHNGTRTLDECLRSLKHLNYPDYEVLLVDDGSSEGVKAIVSRHDHVRYLRQDHGGLSAARNLGAEKSSGEILAYTDDDCMPDEDWLGYLALEFQGRREIGAAGGPNIPPPPQNLAQACVVAAPGAPCHVLLNDQEAEHIPGCNLAVRRNAFKAIGGFKRHYRTAGDDVDFCWRLQICGFRIGFSPPAFVWHYRRFSARDYLRQQIGYGKAEAILMKDHSKRFALFPGGARWFGAVYEPGFESLPPSSPSRIFGGTFGNAPFQSIYTDPVSGCSASIVGFPWFVLALGFLGAAAFGAHWFAPAGIAMLAASAWVTRQRLRKRRVARAFVSGKATALLATLTFLQPLLRGAARMLHAGRLRALPRGSLTGARLFDRPRPRLWKKVGQIALWSSAGRNRDHLLKVLLQEVQLQSWKHRVDDGWGSWDIEYRHDLWWRVRATTVTEYHRGQDRLTRVRFASRMTPLNLALSLALLIAIVVTCWVVNWTALWLFAFGVYFLWWLLLEVKHTTFISRCIRMVLRISQGEGFEPITDAKDRKLRPRDNPA